MPAQQFPWPSFASFYCMLVTQTICMPTVDTFYKLCDGTAMCPKTCMGQLATLILPAAPTPARPAAMLRMHHLPRCHHALVYYYTAPCRCISKTGHQLHLCACQICTACHPSTRKPPSNLPRVCVISLPPCSASYKNKENIDLSNLPKFQRHGADTGSTEVQLARITMRVGQLSAHLANNKKDNSSRRGLQALLAQRKSLLQYLYRNDR